MLVSLGKMRITQQARFQEHIDCSGRGACRAPRGVCNTPTGKLSSPSSCYTCLLSHRYEPFPATTSSLFDGHSCVWQHLVQRRRHDACLAAQRLKHHPV